METRDTLLVQVFVNSFVLENHVVGLGQAAVPLKLEIYFVALSKFCMVCNVLGSKEREIR